MNLCCVRCQGRPVAVDIRDVAGVLRVEQLLPIPLAPANLVGMTVQHRQLIPVVLLASPTSARGESPGSPRSVVLIRTSRGLTGLLVDPEGPVMVREAEARAGAASGVVIDGTTYDRLDPEAFWSGLRSEVEDSFRGLMRDDPGGHPGAEGRHDAP